ncbi:MAG: tRNA (N(6)-L-threonylcarbamoyladenosine(37)-C(2))-methylthiotransferase MtaB [Desulfobacula sp.]|nr:tRNA (N(6)-L-threonylcarbamoyladenosine(37)-C(2))-methylthiotransferase MtaB [Desulfobacula sp.]
MKKFHIKTLGCKVNQYESDGIAQNLKKKGWINWDDKTQADVIIVNTCAVTSKAGMQSRQAIRKLIRQHPFAKVIVTGCHAQTDPDQINKIEHISEIVCHKDKTKIADHISSICDDKSSLTFKKVDHSDSNTFNSFSDAVAGQMTRSYLKIQDGCDSFCTYCIVPYARGGSVSMPQDEVLTNLRQLKVSGFKEVILTGIHTGMYGLDLKKKTSLLNLLEKINSQKSVHRIRLSSIEPTEINEGIIDLARPGNILCDHFHIPLQSGDDDILKRMKRPYDSVFFEGIIHKIHSELPLAGIGVDTLIGFPSETDKQFENTFNLIERLPISYLHVFPFSRRKGTPAYHFDNQVNSSIIKERCNRMRALSNKKQIAFIKTNLNKKVECLVQNKIDTKSGLLKAVTSNYLTVLLNDDHCFKGKILDLIVERCDSALNITGKITN